MSTLRHHLLAAAAALAATSALLAAPAPDYADPWAGYDEFVFFDYTLEQNVMTPAVGRSEHKAVASYVGKVKDQLKANYTLDLMRQGEVLVVTLPTDDLFNPNDTLLTPYGEQRMRPLLGYLQDPAMWKVVYTVNTDDSGSDSYLEHLSEARCNTIYGWLLDGRVPDDLIIIPYPMGQEDPVTTNDSRQGRATNRRIELYLIPGPKLIEQAHEGKLK